MSERPPISTGHTPNMLTPPSLKHRFEHLLARHPVQLVSYAWDEEPEHWGLMCSTCGTIEPYAVPTYGYRRRLGIPPPPFTPPPEMAT